MSYLDVKHAEATKGERNSARPLRVRHAGRVRRLVRRIGRWIDESQTPNYDPPIGR